MGLQDYIVNFISFVNGIVIPFLLGIAFLFFIINVFRFFIVGGSNQESQEKAKSLAIYGVSAFVVILIFWGIVNILTSSLGIARLATYDNTCFDYDPLCNDGIDYGSSGPTSRPVVTGPAGNPVSGGPTTRPSTIPDPVSGGPTTRPIVTKGTEVLTSSGPISRPIVTNGTDLLGTGGPTTRPRNAPGLTGGDYTAVTTNAVASVNSVLPYADNDLFELELSLLREEAVQDEEKLRIAVTLAEIGIITTNEYASVALAINDVREEQGYNRINLATIESYPEYRVQLETYADAVKQSIETLAVATFNNEDAVAPTINNLYNTEEFSLSERMNTANEQYNSMVGTFDSLGTREEFLDSFIAATNVSIERTGINNGEPISKNDVLRRQPASQPGIGGDPATQGS